MSKVYVGEDGVEWSVGDVIDKGINDAAPEYPGVTFEQIAPGSWRVAAIEADEAIVGEITTLDGDDRELRAYVEADRLGRDLVFLNFDSDRGGFFFPVPLDAGTARDLGALLVKAADKVDADLFEAFKASRKA